MTTADSKPNRLIHEKSPYLLQHAYNPVDWYPWGPEAFEKARVENKPVFLSVGYSTCHWCHVMERESFEHPEIAGLLNKSFVSIKVDREERPDVDHVYMDAVMAMTGAGGWPLSAFLTPDLLPFYGGTYFPPRDAHGRPGFPTVLLAIEDKWKNDREAIMKSGTDLSEAIRSRAAAIKEVPEVTDRQILEQAFLEIQGRYDAEHGGFGDAPKFPTPHLLSFLFLFARRSGEDRARQMAEATLQAMARGGIRDFLGGGFHRYSTDARWHVPHFEKMLYDQALLARAYTEAYQVSGQPLYRSVACEILDYVLRDMTAPEGGFFSAEDADSAADPAHLEEKTEGAFYVWTEAEIRALLDPEEADAFCTLYGVGEKGNVQQDPFGEFENKNVLYQNGTVEELAELAGAEAAVFESRLASARRKLFEARKKRPRPHLDDKILTDWNSLMIGAFSLAGRAFEETRYTEAACRAADFMVKKMKTPEGRLLHRYRDGEAVIPAFLDDYAYFLHALLELFLTTGDAQYLQEALQTASDMDRLFGDEAMGGYFFSAGDAESLFTRQKTFYDGALPSGNSMAVWALAVLGHLMQDAAWQEKASRVFEGHWTLLGPRPSLYPAALMGLDLREGGGEELVISGPPESPEMKSWCGEFAAAYEPGRVVLRNFTGPKGDGLRRLLPYLDSRPSDDGKVTAWLCGAGTCYPPVTDLSALKKLLAEREEDG